MLEADRKCTNMTNRLENENSPYLLQHAGNPVDWYPWGPEALEKARTEDKPIFLSIGYAACHWCHVMAHESFEDPATAAWMNQHFINIKVDREERPDLDSIYMHAVVAMTGQGGWPMSVFLTPDGKPFFGGTYFPPVRRYNMPSFNDVLQTIAQLWREDRPRLLESSLQLSEILQQTPILGQAALHWGEEQLKQATTTLAQSYDWTSGGWGKAPKFPQPMAIEFLLRQATRGDALARDMAIHALKAMARGGMYDVVGGGFARYSTDDQWRIPHFEKMLYDNAQLALAYLHGWLVSREPLFRQVCEETLDFILREMTHPQGGFYSSLDADSEGEEGKYYVWTLPEIQSALSNPQEAAFACTAYQITQAGNFEGNNVLQRALTDAALAEQFNISPEEVPDRLAAIHARLRTARSKRTRPGTDDKVLVSWNALALTAFAEAGRYLNRADYLDAARRSAAFLLQEMYQPGRLLRSWRAGQARHNAFLEDYAALIIALLALYQSDPNPTWYTSALRLANEMITHYIDPQGGFFDTRDDHETLLYRPKELQDNATPSGNALASLALLQLSAFGEQGRDRDLAEAMLGAMQEAMLRYPAAVAQWLCAADFALGPVAEVAILGDPADARTQGLLQALWAAYRPRLVAASSPFSLGPAGPPLLQSRPLRDGQPTAYVCRNLICQQPVTRPADLLVQL